MEKKENNQVKKRAYIPPVTRVISAEPTSMTCATVTTNGKGSVINNWDVDTNYGADDSYFGVADVTPSNESGGGWSNDVNIGSDDVYW